MMLQLNEHFEERWIGRVPFRWPPRSPDLTPLDFFCGVTLKLGCTENEDDLIERIFEAARYVDVEMLERVQT
jgi:hypothetical protein